ncbi:MAG: acyltransferase [Methylococcaceae bacterium]|nr:acyltransferase [Methylococcaceae bacterium]
MANLLSRIFSTVRKEGFVIDPAIPCDYLIWLFVEKSIDYLRGLLVFRRPAIRVFLGKNAKIKCVKKIRCGYFVKFSSDTYVDALSKDGIVLGDNFSLGRGASIECTGSLSTLGRGFVAGNNVGIGSFSFLGCAGGITIGDDTIMGNYVSMHSENHAFDRLDLPIRLQGVNHKGIVIGKNCWVGAKVTILDGVHIEDNTIIAAGAVVVAGHYEGFSIYGGVPARKIKPLT